MTSDVPAAASLGPKQTGEQERRQVVDLEVGFVPVVRLLRRCKGAARVVHQQIEGLDTLADLFGESADVIEAGEVGHQRLGAHCFGDGTQLVGRAPSHVDRGALGGQRLGGLRADPVTGSGHEDRAAWHRGIIHTESLGQTPTHSVALGRSRRHSWLRGPSTVAV